MSMGCPKCKGEAMVLDSRRRDDDTTYRRYECCVRKCKARWSTLEQIVRLDKRKVKQGGRGKRLSAILKETNRAETQTHLRTQLKALLGL